MENVWEKHGENAGKPFAPSLYFAAFGAWRFALSHAFSLARVAAFPPNPTSAPNLRPNPSFVRCFLPASIRACISFRARTFVFHTSPIPNRFNPRTVEMWTPWGVMRNTGETVL